MKAFFCYILTSLPRQVSKCEELICEVLTQRIKAPEFSPIKFADRHISRILPSHTIVDHNQVEIPLRQLEALAIGKILSITLRLAFSVLLKIHST